MRLSLLTLFFAALVLNATADDPRGAPHEFVYALYPPGGFSVKKSKAVVRADPKQPKACPLIGADGKFTPLGQWYFDLGSDPMNFQTWWHGYFADTNNWHDGRTPVWSGPMAGNQGHRIIAWLGTFKKLMAADAQLDAAVKASVMNDDWKRAVEKIIGSTVGAKGLLEHSGRMSDMACNFHFIRTKYGTLGLRFDNIYTLERAQNLIATLLTEPWIISAEDRYLAPPDANYLEALGPQTKGGLSGDIRLVKDGKIFFGGGMFIGWKDKPALHGTWDGLAIINALFKYYPEPDPAHPKSIFYKWNILPDAQKDLAKKMIVLCSRRLWLDWQEHKGPTWCWVHGGKPTDDDSQPSEAPFLPAYDGYGDNQFGWAKLCWEEMFGNPSRNTNDGVQALLAIAHGKIHRDLKTPVGQQVPGRYDYDPALQKKVLEDDLKRLGLSPDKAPGADAEAPRLKADPKGKGVSE